MAPKQHYLLILVTLCLIAAILAAGCTSQTSSNQTASARGTVYESPMNVGDMSNQLTTGKIDAFVSWEPISSQAYLNGTGVVLAYSDAIWPQHLGDVIVISNSSMQKLDRNVLLGLAWAHVKGTNYINDPNNHDSVVQYIANDSGVSLQAANESLKHVQYTDDLNPDSIKAYYNELKSLSYLNKSVTDLGYANESQFFDSFIMPDYVKEVKDHLAGDPNWKPPVANASINVGFLTADSTRLASIVAEKQGYYNASGLTVNFKAYPNGVAMMNGFKTGALDAGYVGAPPAILARVNDDVKINITVEINHDGSAIVVKPGAGIHAIADLSGKTVGIPAVGTVQDIVLRKAAQQNNLTVAVK
jgi:ABC-type nitrate/sulfonate/bicarbonate transport system substrate-binding protein